LLFAAEFAALHATKKRADENRQSRRSAFQGEGESMSRLLRGGTWMGKRT
jgi:hypothetical protein